MEGLGRVSRRDLPPEGGLWPFPRRRGSGDWGLPEGDRATRAQQAAGLLSHGLWLLSGCWGDLLGQTGALGPGQGPVSLHLWTPTSSSQLAAPCRGASPQGERGRPPGESPSPLEGAAGTWGLSGRFPEQVCGAAVLSSGASSTGGDVGLCPALPRGGLPTSSLHDSG